MGSSTDWEREAHNKGETDYKKSGGHVDSNPITELFHPTYNPPSGHDKEYGAGWDNAKKQDPNRGK